MFRVTLIVAAMMAQTAVAGPALRAVPNDGGDDRVELQAWIDTACASGDRSLVLPAGDWHVTRGPDNAGSLQIRCDGLSITGMGRASRIRMKGSARLSPTGAPAGWIVFAISAQRVTLNNLAIDGAGRSDTGEQTHLIQIDGPARGVRLRRLFLDLPILAVPPGAVPCKADAAIERATRMCSVPGQGNVLCESLRHEPHCSLTAGVFTLLGWFQGGDCIRSVGQVGAPVEGVTITEVDAAACARSFVTLQRQSREVTIALNVTKVIGGQIVDLEPSGSSGIRDIVIRRNRFARGASTPRLAAISLAGTGTDTAQAIVVSANFLDGGIVASNVVRVAITNNRMVGHHVRPDVAIVDLRRTANVRVEGNRIERVREASAGRVLDINGTDIGITRNRLRQQTPSDVIFVANAQRVSIVGNSILCRQPHGDHLSLRVGTGVSDLEVRRNRTRGSCPPPREP